MQRLLLRRHGWAGLARTSVHTIPVCFSERVYVRLKATVTALDLLKQSNITAVHVVNENEPVLVAMQRMCEEGTGSLVVQDSNERVVGFLTQRDLIRGIVSRGVMREHGQEPVGWNVQVANIMTPSKDLVYLSPMDTLEAARSLMAVSGKRHIPVISGSTLLGVINPKEIARFLHLSTAGEQSAKTDYVSTVMPRKGMPLGTRLHANAQPTAHITNRCALISAVCNLPHPAKEATGGEDAFLLGPHMIGVADGVGSWWEGGIDPATYARALMQAACTSCSLMKLDKELSPQQVLLEAWHTLQRAGIVGSCTACLVALHPHRQELRAANIGDSGFIILRRNAGEQQTTLGTLDAAGATSRRQYHVAFRSPQQLRAFNTPYQLGRAPDDDSDGSVPDSRFETPHDASLTRVPVRSGDVLILATDGLFDNMAEDAVLDLMEAESEHADPALLARLIAHKAKELSLDREVDSPFALLAKENDILWGGGRPDDITIIVGRIVDCDTDTAQSELSPAYAGPGDPPIELPLPAAEEIDMNHE